MSSQMAKAHTPKAGTALPIEQRHVNMSNALARASHSLSLSEKRVIACGIANTDSLDVKDYNLSVLKGGGWYSDGYGSSGSTKGSDGGSSSGGSSSGGSSSGGSSSGGSDS